MRCPQTNDTCIGRGRKKEPDAECRPMLVNYLKTVGFCALFLHHFTNIRKEAGMKIEAEGQTLRVSAVEQLGAANANSFRDSVRDSLEDAQKNIDIDLSQTTFLDSCGLGALVALQKTASGRQGMLRLLNPQPPVEQILELTRMDRILE